MKAAVCTRYGPPEVLQLRDVEKPMPGRKDLLVRIHASSVTVTDCRIRSGVPTAPLWFRVLARLATGIRGPRRSVLGSVLSGEVEEIGTGVTQFRPGDRVFAYTMMRLGCYAEYATIPASSIVVSVPSNLTYEGAASLLYGGLIAAHFVKKAEIQPGQQVLIYGASGAVGASALQLAKHFGAHVTAVCGPSNIELVKSLGADAALDYTKDHSPGERRFDFVLDAVGKRKTSALKVACETALTPRGKHMSVDAGLPMPRLVNLRLLKEVAEAGRIRPVIDRRYRLEQIVDAHRYVEQGHKRGDVIVSVVPGESA